MKTLLSADWIAPMCSPLIRDGAVVFEAGRVLAVGPAGDLRRRHDDAEAHALPGAILLPGLVNAHTHLELSGVAREALPGGGFPEWVLRLRARARPEETEKYVPQAVRDGIAQCLRFGVTMVGDISRAPALSRGVLRESPLRAVSFGEVIAMARSRDRAPGAIAVALDAGTAGERVRAGISPHAPYTVEPEIYRQCLAAAGEAPIATHLAETPFEAEFLAGHGGPLREIWDIVGGLDDQVPRFEGGPIRLAQAVGLLDRPAVLAHVNYADEPELALLAAGRASVVYCPRTHAYFEHAPHPWLRMLERGINVAVGPDSCASSPDLNLVDDLRMLHGRFPQVAVQTLWEMATVRGARALGAAGAGVIAPGGPADLVAFDVRTAMPLLEILERNLLPREVWIAGERVGAPS